MSLPSNRAVNRNRRPRRFIMILTPSICWWEGRWSGVRVPDNEPRLFTPFSLTQFQTGERKHFLSLNSGPGAVLNQEPNQRGERHHWS